MAAHMVAMLYGTDFSWMPEYAANVPQIIAKYGGSYTLKSAGQVEVPEGTIEPPAGVGVFTFPSRQAIHDFLNSDEYRPYIELRNRFSRTEILIFDA